MDGRLVRREGTPETQGLRHQSPGRKPRHQNAPSGRSKKSPALATVGDIAAAWSEGKTGHAQAVAQEIRSALGTLKPHHLTPLILDAMVHRWKKRWNLSTCYSRIGLLKHFLRSMEDLGGPRHLDRQILTLRKPTPRQFIALPNETDALVSNAPPWLRCWLLLCIDLGLRMAEALRAAPAHYDEHAQLIKLPTKGGDYKTMPVTPELSKLFATAPPAADPHTPYIEQLAGKPRDAHAVYRAWKKLKAAHGVRPNLRPHDLRRTSATMLYRNTKDLRLVQQFLGHRNMASTAHYLVEQDPEKLRPLIEALRWQTRKIQ